VGPSTSEVSLASPFQSVNATRPRGRPGSGPQALPSRIQGIRQFKEWAACAEYLLVGTCAGPASSGQPSSSDRDRRHGCRTPPGQWELWSRGPVRWLTEALLGFAGPAALLRHPLPRDRIVPAPWRRPLRRGIGADGHRSTDSQRLRLHNPRQPGELGASGGEGGATKRRPRAPSNTQRPQPAGST
jgi:hypothetical protein